MNYSELYADYKWIKVKRYQMDESKSWEERYKDLDAHHVAETTFLIEEIRKLAKIADNPLRMGPLGDNFTFKNKWRWLIELKKDDKVILPCTFAKLNQRPWDEGLSSCVTEIDNHWTIIGVGPDSVLDDTLQGCSAEIKLANGCGNIVESWDIKDLKVLTSKVESDEFDAVLELWVKYLSTNCKRTNHCGH